MLTIGPKNVIEEHWINAMQEELLEFQKCNAWYLTTLSKVANVIGTKWIYRNKSNLKGNIKRNKAKLVAQGHSQEEGINYGETFATVTRLESVRFLMGITCSIWFQLYQIDVKSVYLNENLIEEVYAKQPKGFEDRDFPNHFYRLNKAPYDLKQALRSWYNTFSEFLFTKGYTRGIADMILFVMKNRNNVLLVQVYVDDLVFESHSNTLFDEFSSLKYVI